MTSAEAFQLSIACAISFMEKRLIRFPTYLAAHRLTTRTSPSPFAGIMRKKPGTWFQKSGRLK